MAETEPQTLANHARFDPWYHVVAFGLLMLSLLIALIRLIAVIRHYHRPTLETSWEVIFTVAALVLLIKVRTYALHNQDRLIRLEETLRLERVLPEPLRARIPELTPGQFIALRFAPDQELPTLVEQALSEHLDREAIKRRIGTWRPDVFRV